VDSFKEFGRGVQSDRRLFRYRGAVAATSGPSKPGPYKSAQLTTTLKMHPKSLIPPSTPLRGFARSLALLVLLFGSAAGSAAAR